MRSRRLLPLALLLAASNVEAARAQPRLEGRPPFLGETLRFTMTILGATGGELTLSAKEAQLDGNTVYKFEMSAISSELLSKFFLVRDYLASWTDPRTFRSLRFEKHTVEGKRVRDDLIEFDYDKKIAYRDKKPIPITDFTLDSLSSVYYIRLLDLESTQKVSLNVVSRRLFSLDVVVGGRETVQTPAGTFRTIRVEPRSESDGLIGKGKNLVLWLTDDARRMPVQIRSKLKVGTLVGKLRAIEKN